MRPRQTCVSSRGLDEQHGTIVRLQLVRVLGAHLEAVLDHDAFNGRRVDLRIECIRKVAEADGLARAHFTRVALVAPGRYRRSHQ